MTARSTLLLTHDLALQSVVSASTRRESAQLHIACDAGEALQIVCAHGPDLDVAIIDFEDGCHGMTLLSALHLCQPQLRIVAIVSNDVYHAAAIAYANGVTACLAKPINSEDLRLVLEEVNAPKLQLAA